MKTTQLPVFRKTYDLVSLIYKITNKFPKAYKHNLGEDMKRQSLLLLKRLFKANRTNNNEFRVKILEDFLDDYDLLKVLIRLMNEEGIVTIKDSSNLVLITENITKQVNGWKNKTEKSEEKIIS